MGRPRKPTQVLMAAVHEVLMDAVDFEGFAFRAKWASQLGLVGKTVRRTK